MRQDKPAKDPEPGPVAIVEHGDVAVKIYQGVNRKKDGRVYDMFTAAFTENGRRARRTFSRLDRAKAEAKKIAQRLSRGEHRAAGITSEDATSFFHACDILRPLGIPLVPAVQEYALAKKAAKGHSIVQAAEEFEVRQRQQHTEAFAGAVVDELLDRLKERRDRETISLRYQQSMRSVLNRFKSVFGNLRIASITSLQIETWLFPMQLAPRTRNNFRTSLVTLFHFARTRGYLPRGVTTEADGVSHDALTTSAANTYRPHELQKLLVKADPRVLPAIAISAFTGLRTASVARLHWENVRWEQSVVEIPASIAKMKKRYLAPLLPCLVSWLEPYRERKGKVITGVRLASNLRELFKKVKIERRHNGFRDSFISYRVAATKNIPQVAYEAGTSVEMIKSKYLEAVTEAEALLWFSVQRDMPVNVIRRTA